MCHIMALDEGIGADDYTLSLIEADLLRAAEVDDEGHGFAIMRPGRKMLTGTNMDAATAVAAFSVYRRQWPDSPAVFHSRLATTGRVSLDECHPFLTPDNHTAVFLNGTLPPPWNEPGQNDTREFALTLHEMTRWRDDLAADSGELTMLVPVLGGLIGKQNKMLIMTDDPSQSRPMHVINRDQWVTTAYGALCSNADHLGKGVGWDEAAFDGDLYRWRIVQPGQCAGCHLYGCERSCAPRPFDPPAFRNETRRREAVR